MFPIKNMYIRYQFLTEKVSHAIAIEIRLVVGRLSNKYIKACVNGE